MANTVRGKILETALNLTEGDRNKVYGDPAPNMRCFANLIDAYLEGKPAPSITPVDGAIIMALAKISRIAFNDQHADSYIDAAAYLAIAGECALI